ncbi:MAG: hypothetical protein AB7F82_08300, partial [Alphaproteobacteria bacterium]
TMLSHIGSYIQSQQDTSLRTDMASLEGKQPYETPSFSLFIGDAHAGPTPPSEEGGGDDGGGDEGVDK